MRTLLFLAFIFTAVVGDAQTLSRHDFRMKNFPKTWFASVNGGFNLYYGDLDPQMSLTDRYTPALDVAVGRWINPYWGGRLQYAGLKGKGINDEPTDFTGTTPDYEGQRYIESFNYMNLHADAFFSFLTIMNGFEEERRFEMLPFVGVGIARAWNEKASNVTPSFTMGLENRFKLTEQFDVNLEIKGTIVGDRLEGVVKEVGSPAEGVLATTLGLTYKFVSDGGGRSKKRR